MALVIYIKEPPRAHPRFPIYTARRKRLIRRGERFFFGMLAAIGLFSMIFALWPLLVWYLTTLPRLNQKVEITPIPQNQVLGAEATLGANVQVVADPDGFSFFTTDYKPPGPRPGEFYLTVPKLEIKKAKVVVDNLNFTKNLSHFPGSAIPGDVGNAFVTGHSVLPQLNDPEDYRAIFTKLSDLEIGDDVLVEIEGKTLHFTVQYAKVVDPHDTTVLASISPSSRNLTLMTCVPPGTNSKRLVVITSLI